MADDNVDKAKEDQELCDELAAAAIQLHAAFLRASTGLGNSRINFTDKQAFELTKTMLFEVLKAEDLDLMPVTYASEKVYEPDETFDLWHAVSDDSVEIGKMPAVDSACGLRFRPVDVITEPRTLIDWAEEDNLCGCAAVMPTEEQCKAAGVQLQIGGTSMTEDAAKKLIEEHNDPVNLDP